MITKLFIYSIPVLMLIGTIFGFTNDDKPNTTLSSTREFIDGSNQNPPIIPNAVGDSCFGTGSERHDDGSFENGGGWNATVTDGRLTMKFRPASYPWKYTKFCVGLTRLATGSDSLKFDLVIYDSTGAGGTPGNLLGTLPNLTAKPVLVFPAYSWFSYDISSVAGNTLTDGAIYIGLKFDASIASQANKFVMIDETVSTPIWPGYAWANVAPWTTAQTFWPNYRSWAMRTIGQTPGSGPCLFAWETQTSGTTALLHSVSTVSDQIGWAGGAGAVVRRTTDGGATWTNGNPNPGVITGDIYNIYAWSANDAICTTSPSSTFVYKTTNGGTNWTQTFTLAGGFINALQMISPTEGYGEGDPVGGKWTIIKTTDGGNSWARMATEPTQVGTEAGWNNSFQVLGTNIWFGTSATKVYHSTDLGLTWTSGAATGVASTFALHYNNATTGLTGGSGTVMLKSTNGGTSYESAGNLPGAAGSISGISGSGTDWWAVRTGADVYRSTNLGGTWTTAYTVTGATFSDIDLKDVNGCPTGWTVSQNGAIAKMKPGTIGISGYSGEIPSSYTLKQNFPNPFNPTTNINFTIPQSGLVKLTVYDMVGKEVATLVNEVKTAGNYIVGFNAANLPSGAYFYRIEANNFVDTKKMLLIK